MVSPKSRTHSHDDHKRRTNIRSIDISMTSPQVRRPYHCPVFFRISNVSLSGRKINQPVEKGFLKFQDVLLSTQRGRDVSLPSPFLPSPKRRKVNPLRYWAVPSQL